MTLCDVMTAAATGPAEDQLNDDVVVEILQRLPTAAVLRSRAVCKAWQRMSSSAEFIAAHARRRPLELIFQRGGTISGALETIPLGTLDEAEHRCLRHLQYPAYTPTGRDWSGYFLIDSCDGLLLFQRDSDRKDFAVCNPVTQQWSMVPRVPGAVYTVPTGFYVHGPSGEHRLLCLAADDQGGSHYVCSLEVEVEAAQACRRLGQAWPWPWGNLCEDLPVRYVNHGGKLHWSQHPKIRFSTDPWPPGAEGLRLTILAFDTVLETFRRIRRPPWKGDSSFLLEMDGMLAMGDFHILRFVDIWVLQDYNDDESWTLRVRVHLPQQLLGSCWAMNTGTGVQGRSVILLGNLMRSWVALYDVAEKRVLKQTQLATSDNSIPLNVLVFKDTLERHPSIFTNESTPLFFSRKRKVHT